MIMVNLVDKPSTVENEIKGAIENGYMPFLWDSCFGFKLNGIYNDFNSSIDGSVSSNAVNEDTQHVLHVNLTNKCSKGEILNYLKGNHNEAKPIAKSSDNIKTYKSEGIGQNITDRSEKCVGHNFEQPPRFKVCSLEVKKIKALLDRYNRCSFRVKNGSGVSQQSRHNQIMKDLIQTSLFEKWNATKRSLIAI